MFFYIFLIQILHSALILDLNRDKCISKIKESFKNLETENSNLSPDKAKFLEINVLTFYHSPREAKSQLRQMETNSKLLTNGKRIYYSSKEVDVIRDEAVQVSILKSEKIIQISKAPQSNIQTKAIVSFNAFRDSVLFNAKSYSCEVVEKNGIKHRQIIFNLNEKDAKQTGTNKVEYLIAEETSLLKRIVIHYLNKDADRMEMSFVKNEIRDLGILGSKAKFFVLDTKGNLKPSFAGYKLVNQLR